MDGFLLVLQDYYRDTLRFREEILPLLVAAPGLRPITLFDEMERRHPDRIGPSFRRVTC